MGSRQLTLTLPLRGFPLPVGEGVRFPLRGKVAAQAAG